MTHLSTLVFVQGSCEGKDDNHGTCTEACEPETGGSWQPEHGARQERTDKRKRLTLILQGPCCLFGVVLFKSWGKKNQQKSRAKQPINIQAVAMTALVWRQSEDVTSTKPRSGVNPDVHPTLPKWHSQAERKQTSTDAPNPHPQPSSGPGRSLAGWSRLPVVTSLRKQADPSESNATAKLPRARHKSIREFDRRVCSLFSVTTT